MKIRIRWRTVLPMRTSSFLRWSRYLFFISGIIALGYVAFALLDAKLYQAYQTRRFQQALKDLNPSISGREQLGHTFHQTQRKKRRAQVQRVFTERASDALRWGRSR